MAKPSLQASKEGQRLAAQSLTLAGLTKTSLSNAVGCSRQPVTNFFQGVAIEQGLFLRLCDRLDLDWQVIAGLTQCPDATVTPKLSQETKKVERLDELEETTDIDWLVRSLRQTAAESLYERCGTMRVLDMSQPVGLGELYTNVNILEQISSHQRRPLQDLLVQAQAGDFDRLGFGQVLQPRVPVMEAVAQHKKLIVLGKPGAGKTTFLKHLAIQCIDGQFEPDRLPLFINLKQFAENPNRLGLLSFLSHRHLKSRITALSETEIEKHLLQLKQVLSAGRALLLLDGLDEVTQDAHDWVLREIRIVSEEFHDNHFLMTCRVAAWEYTFEQFTEVEIADFDADQVEAFAHRWFANKPILPQTFLQSLSKRPRLVELAVTPLLLTLLCLAFEVSSSLPSSRSELYQEGIETLLKKWDSSRGIHRDQVYKKLSLRRKEDLLSQIALTTFQQAQYFFRQHDLEYLITHYIRNLPEASDDLEVLQVDSTTVLHSIEAQHGLLVERAKRCYSFSHLTFHEYFVARELTLNSANLKETMARLADEQALQPRWREVFLLASELLRDANLLLFPLAAKVSSLLAESSRLQAFLADVTQQANQPYFESFKPSAVRAFLFDIDFDIDENRAVAIRLDQRANLLVCASFLTRMLEGVSLEAAIARVKQYDQQVSEPLKQIAQCKSANEAMMIAIGIVLDSKKLKPSEDKKLKDIIERFHIEQFYPETAEVEAIKDVADAARHVAKNRHHIRQKWTFSDDEKQLLKQYYRAAKLLVDCLYSDGCMLEPARRRAIEKILFSPAVVSDVD
ncbi:NACHT domain-containing NTPase [Synechococcus sp. PCC 7335]|uniref:NACHT domain-containing protein n=1 Tax=Synechococcus sp. (strain ATCC 29403 / PCC 7335) TaxID=91464 RepID=UPI0002DE60BD|nr:NACHT domain-containing protein [Synechococcus sp. PCC 7335]